MSKGLPRSLSRGDTQQEAVTKIRIVIDHPVSVSATGVAVGFGTVELAGLPEGYLKLTAKAIQVQFIGMGSADLADTWDGDFSVGSTATADVTLNGTDVDMIASTAIGAATGELSPVKTVANGVDSVLDNTAGNLSVNLNVLVDAADITDDTTVVLQAVGVVEIVLITMLDK